MTDVPMRETTDVQAPSSAGRDNEWPSAIVPTVLAVLYWAYVFVSGTVVEMPGFTRFMSRLVAEAVWLLAFLIWWLTRRRIRWADRLLGLAAAAALGAATAALTHRTLPGAFLVILGLPCMLTVWTLWLIAARRAPLPARRFGLVAAIMLGWMPFVLIRMNGLTGDMGFDVHWRWTRSAEELYLAQRAGAPTGHTLSPTGASATGPALESAALDPAPTDWPAFRGAQRDGVVRGLKIRTDWNDHPPQRLWRQRIGPAWSSVAVVGDRLFTQEQRGESEAVLCLDAQTGQEIWAWMDPARFWDAQGGTGPRATPTYWHGRVYALGATGTLNCLDAATGRRFWRRDLRADAAVETPIWGFSSSPLVVGGLVVVYAGGDHGKGLLGYHASDGSPAWSAPAGRMTYASPQLATVDGQEQILFLSDAGVVSVAPADGTILWNYENAVRAPRSVQPHAIDDHRVLFAAGLDLGTSLLEIAHESAQWKVTPAWTSQALKPSFNDFVVEAGSGYGLDGSIMSCIDLASGQRRWKHGRYGRGQVLLLAEQHLLLIAAETGEVALVAADPSGFRELGRFQAIEGKTWTHPAVAGNRLYVRNAEEIACYQLEPEKAPLQAAAR